MKRLILLFFALMAIGATTGRAADVVISDITFGQHYRTSEYAAFSATLHVAESGILRVMSTTSDYPFPYADPDHTELLDYNASFYSDGQGYVIPVSEGDVIYFYRDFCMSISQVWFTMEKAELTCQPTPAEGERLVPTGRAQLEVDFNMPVATSGGTMTCGTLSAPLAAQGGSLYLLYEIKDIIMRWLDAGVPAGTRIDIELYDVHACVDASILYGTDGTLRLHFTMPAMPGKLVSCNFEDTSFLSYYLPDDDAGLFRMTFSRPVSTTEPGYLNLIYGSAEAGEVNSMVFDGRADGNDLLFDLRGIDFSPEALIGPSATKYDVILVRPGGVHDANGDLMFSPGIGTLASWTYELPYVYLTGTPSWEVFYEDDSDIYTLRAGDRVELYVYNYHVVKADGVLLTFDDGTTVRVPLSNCDVEYETNGTTAAVIFTVPGSRGNHSQVTVSFDNLRLLSGETAPSLAETFAWDNTPLTHIASASAGAAAKGVYDLSGRRAHNFARFRIEDGRAVLR